MGPPAAAPCSKQHDFGSDIIPGAKDLGYKVQAHLFKGYWVSRRRCRRRRTADWQCWGSLRTRPGPALPGVADVQASPGGTYWAAQMLTAPSSPAPCVQEDIGTVRAFYESNLALTDSPNPNFRWAGRAGRVAGSVCSTSVVSWKHDRVGCWEDVERAQCVDRCASNLVSGGACECCPAASFLAAPSTHAADTSRAPQLL